MTDTVAPPSPNEVLTPTEFAHSVGVSTKTARAWAASGTIEAHKTPGGHWRIPVSQLTNRDLSLSQFARLVGVHRGTVRRWCEAGKITCRKTPGGYWRIPMSEVPRVGRRHKVAASQRRAPAPASTSC